MDETTGTSEVVGTDMAPRAAPPVREQLTVAGHQLLATLRRIVAEGNVRSIVVRRDGRVVVSFPVTVGVVGAVLAPQIAFFGTIAAVLTQCTIEVIHEDAPHAPTP